METAGAPVSVIDFESPATIFYRHVAPSQDGRVEGHLAMTTADDVAWCFQLFSTRMLRGTDPPTTVLNQSFVEGLINRGQWLKCPGCRANCNGRFLVQPA